MAEQTVEKISGVDQVPERQPPPVPPVKREPIPEDLPPPPLSHPDLGYSWIGPWRFRFRIFKDDEPLYLPRGSVRAAITLILLSAVVYGNLKGLAIHEQLWTLAAAAVFYYFGSRASPPSKP